MVEVSIIVPVWNRGDLTMQFLYQHWAQARGHDAEFVVVDNGSEDNTPRVLETWELRMEGRLVILRNEENRGFGPGHNQGAEAAKGNILVFLSNDVAALGDYLTPLKDSVVDGALYGAELLNWDTGWNKFDGQVIPYLAGWCIAATRPTWDELGGWDERYVPCDYEDLDLSYTAMKKGMRLVNLELPLRHTFGQSARNLGGGRQAITMRNREKFMEKWALGPSALGRRGLSL